MSREVLILRGPEIRALLDPQGCIAAMEQAFAAYSTGQAQLPGVIHLDIPESDVPEKRGEIHVKAGYLNGSPYYAVKIVSGFASNLQRGLPPNDGMVVVFDAHTGAQPRSSSTMDLSPTSEPGPQARSPRNILRARTLLQSR